MNESRWNVMPHRSRPGFPAVITLASLLAAAGAASAQPAPVRVDAARVETVQQHRQVTGNLRAIARSRVAAMESGIVMELPVTEGRRVAKEDVLARLDDRRIRIQLRQVEAQLSVLEATLAEREAQLRLRESDLETLHRLQERGAVTLKEVADARLEVNVAMARRDQALRDIDATNAAADLLRRRLADTVIRAPFDGVVLTRLTEVGEWIAEGDPIAEVVAINTFEVWLDVPQRHMAAVAARGLQVVVHVEALDREFTSSSVRIIRDVDPLSRTFSTIVHIEDEDDLLSPGMSAIAWLPTAAMADHLTIHKDAILRGDMGAFVYAVRHNSPDEAHAVAVPLQVLFDVGERVVVRAPALEAGEMIVVEGNERLSPMQSVRIVEDPLSRDGAQAARLE